jgi:spore coat-associated protein N
MNRQLRALTRGTRKWLLLACLASTAVAMNGVLFSGADLATRTSNPILAASGILKMGNPGAGGAILSASGMKPGDTRSGTLSISNDGSVGGSYKLTAGGLTDTPSSPSLSQTLNLSIDDITSGPATNLYSGTLAGFSQATLGSFTAGQSRTYRFQLSWPSASANTALQGAQTSVTFAWKANT